MAQKPAGKGMLRGVLYLLTGSNPGEAIKLRRDSTIFGREKGDIVIDDHEISATHFQIQCINGIYHIFDMNSTNGTYVNREKIVRAKLSSNDLITAGRTSFKFVTEDESKLRKISTVYNPGQQAKNSDQRTSVVDTLIENELKSSRNWGIRLDVVYDDGKREEIILEQNTTYIGRASSFGRFDQDSEISRKHLKVKVNEQGEVFVEDQGSTNGSFINNTRIQGMQPVTPADEIRIGLCNLRIQTLFR